MLFENLCSEVVPESWIMSSSEQFLRHLSEVALQSWIKPSFEQFCGMQPPSLCPGSFWVKLHSLSVAPEPLAIWNKKLEGLDPLCCLKICVLKQSPRLGLCHRPSSFCGIFPKWPFSLGLNHHPSSFAACSLRAHVRVLFWVKLHSLSGSRFLSSKNSGAMYPVAPCFLRVLLFRKEVG